MAKPKKTSKSKPSRRKSRKRRADQAPTRSEQAIEKRAAKLEARRKGIRERHKLIALALASLVGGFLAVINLDRITHVDRVKQLGASHHGWPFVYLKRSLEEEPIIFIHGNTYSWPWPVEKDEIRETNYQNLIFDILIGVLMTIVTYWIISFGVLKYDRWMHPECFQ